MTRFATDNRSLRLLNDIWTHQLETSGAPFFERSLRHAISKSAKMQRAFGIEPAGSTGSTSASVDDGILQKKNVFIFFSN